MAYELNIFSIQNDKLCLSQSEYLSYASRTFSSRIFGYRKLDGHVVSILLSDKTRLWRHKQLRRHKCYGRRFSEKKVLWSVLWAQDCKLQGQDSQSESMWAVYWVNNFNRCHSFSLTQPLRWTLPTLKRILIAQKKLNKFKLPQHKFFQFLWNVDKHKWLPLCKSPCKHHSKPIMLDLPKDSW